VIGKIGQFVSINSAIQVDLYGQVNAETIHGRQVSSVGGSQSFIWGASGRKRKIDNRASFYGSRREDIRVVPRLETGNGVTTPRADTNLSPPEFGVVDLRGKTLSRGRRH